MKPAELKQFLQPSLSSAGFELDEVQDALSFGDRPAWAMFYRNRECKLQICWSARDGGIDFMLALLNAPNEFGLLNRSKQWHFMLMLSTALDDLSTPGLDADDDELLTWLKALFDVHFDSACNALLRKG